MAASKPTSLLSLANDTFHPLALNWYLRTLTVVWVVPLSVIKFTPDYLFPDVYNAIKFGVGQETEPFRVLNPQSVALPSLQSRSRLDYGQFWQEPAITGFDWLFTPSPSSEERLSTEPLQASTPFNGGFTLTWVRSPGFRSCPYDSRHFHTSLLVNCEKLLSLRVLPSKNYPCHINTLPGTLFETDDTTP